MSSPQPDGHGPPLLFRRAGASDRYELVEVGGPAVAHAVAHADERTWSIVEIEARSTAEAVRLIDEVRAEAVRAGALCLTIDLAGGVPDAPSVRRAVGARDLGAWLLIDL